jgi:predicted nuclease of predicted toxin-antitoxin system
VKLAECPWLADENIHHEVVAALNARGWDVVSAADLGLAGKSDVTILDQAWKEQRAVITHDSDFGTAVFAGGRPVVGILYLRPGHILPAVTLQTVEAVKAASLELEPPFLIVGERSAQRVKIRLRNIPKT